MSATIRNPLTRYDYQQLPDSSCWIRLLRLLPAVTPASPIELELHHVRLDETLSYEALSYCWGDASTTEALRIDGKLFDVTANLAAALRALRFEHEHRTMWVDAICIDQLDIPEKNKQVGLMRNIYSHSSCTIVWLGPGNKDIRNGFRETREPRYFNQVGFMANLRSFLGFRSMLRAEQAIKCQAWFSRIWVVQEVAFSKVITVQCGSDQLTWDEFVSCCSRLDTPDFVIQLLVSGTRPANPAIGLESMHATRSRILEGRRLSLYKALRGFRSYEASRPVDKVYAVLGMLRHPEDVSIDYGLDPQILYRNVTLAVIRQTESLDILREAVQNQQDSNLAGKMTWIPDWANGERRRWPYTSGNSPVSTPVVEMPARASNSHFSMPKLHANGTLEVNGQFIARIEELGTPLPSSSAAEARFWPAGKRLPNIALLSTLSLEVDELLKDWRRVASKTNGDQGTIQDAYVTGQTNLEVFYHILLGQSFPLASHTLAQEFDDFMCACELLWQWFSWVCAVFFKPLNPLLATIIGGPSLALTFLPTFCVHYIRGAIRFRVVVPELQYTDDWDGWVFGRTDNGLLGTFPGSGYYAEHALRAVPSDSVVIFEEASEPFVIRRAGDQWRLVGVAHVHGIMHGAAFKKEQCVPITLC